MTAASILGRIKGPKLGQLPVGASVRPQWTWLKVVDCHDLWTLCKKSLLDRFEVTLFDIETEKEVAYFALCNATPTQATAYGVWFAGAEDKAPVLFNGCRQLVAVIATKAVA